METTGRRTRDRSDAGVLAAIADRRRRRLLAILLERAGPVSEEALVTRLATAETGRPPDGVPPSAVDSRRVELSHVHLPALGAAELVDYDRGAGTVAATDHPAFDDPAVEHVLETDAERWDDVLDCLADARCRTVLSVLVRAGEPIARADLVRAVAAHEAGDGDTADAEAVERLRSTLYHVHLPKLADAGLVDRDAGPGTVAYEGHPAIEREWLDVRPGDTSRPILPSARREDGLWRLEGRAHVTERGRTLCDEADEELVVMLATDGLLEAACIRRLADAVDRGVDVSVGTPSSSVRERIREDVPGATLWEPRLDWPAVSPPGTTAGRLVMADRSAFLVGTVGGEGDDAGVAETAITATGTDDATIVWLRELLGSRLDQVGDRGGDVSSGITH